MSDNGPQYSSEEFRVFCTKYGIEHVTSSPLFPQSNGFIERTVQTIKRMFTKAKETNSDPHLAMLCLRTTPVDHNLPSPSELLNGRQYKSNLPTVSTRPNGEVNTYLQQRQHNEKTYYDRASKELTPLAPQQTVRVLNPTRKTWDLAKVVSSANTPRSYNIQTTRGATYRRNRKHLRDTPETWKEDDTQSDIQDDQSPGRPDAIGALSSSPVVSHASHVDSRRSGRVRKPPTRLGLVSRSIR